MIKHINYLNTFNTFNTNTIMTFNKNCVVCGSDVDLIIDYKNDLYRELKISDTKKHTNEDFQCLCNHCNFKNNKKLILVFL
jgi:hypothetical protein